MLFDGSGYHFHTKKKPHLALKALACPIIIQSLGTLVLSRQDLSFFSMKVIPGTIKIIYIDALFKSYRR